MPTSRELVRDAEEVLVAGIDQAKAWLGSPTGRRARSLAARGLILASPVILRHPFFKTPVGRVVELAGGATLVVKLAETIRDWDPSPSA